MAVRPIRRRESVLLVGEITDGAGGTRARPRGCRRPSSPPTRHPRPCPMSIPATAGPMIDPTVHTIDWSALYRPRRLPRPRGRCRSPNRGPDRLGQAEDPQPEDGAHHGNHHAPARRAATSHDRDQVRPATASSRVRLPLDGRSVAIPAEDDDPGVGAERPPRALVRDSATSTAYAVETSLHLGVPEVIARMETPVSRSAVRSRRTADQPGAGGCGRRRRPGSGRHRRPRASQSRSGASRSRGAATRR